MQADLAAPPTASVTRTVGMLLVVATIALTMLTDAHGGDLLTDPPLLMIPQHPLLGHCRLALLSHLHQPPSAAVPAALAPAHGLATAYADSGSTRVLTLSGTRDGTDGNGASAVPLSRARAGTDGADASGMPAPSGAGPGAQ